MIDLESIRSALKELLVEDGIGECLLSLKAQLPAGSPKINEILSIETRLNKLNRDVLKNEITQEAYDVEYAQMIQLVLLMVDELQADDFEEQAPGRKSKQGSILYQIPEIMTLDEESECRIRLAFQETAILDNIRITKDTELKSIRVSEIMEVEIIDPAKSPNFEIRPMVSKRMFLDKDDYAEWIFFVKPLKIGQHELWLKVSVLEERLDELVQRDLVMKEMIEILAVPAAGPVLVAEKLAQYSLHSGQAAVQIPPQEPTPAIPLFDPEEITRGDRPRIVIAEKEDSGAL
ncbi:MAG: hypothetical protein KDC44_16160, partial [Phaeodactylibacter sp.]|nr:hypothetical protein [Phaeodactylibacter sp.]